MKHILVTGGSGFVGKNFVSYLRERLKNVILFRRDQLENFTGQEFDNVEAIVHLAGKAHDLQKSSNPQEYYEVNYWLTKKLYDAFLKSDTQKFIFISSVKASADMVSGVLTEDLLADPKTDYGKSKLMAEQYIQNQTLPIGKSYFILRPCMIHGRGNKGNLNLLFNFVKKGIPYPLAGFNNQRSFLSIENLCFVINELIDRDDISNGIYQVADDEPISTNEVVSILATSLNIRPKLWRISPSLIKSLAHIGGLFKLPLTTERLTKLTESYVVSNEKLKAVLKKPLPLTTVEGLTITGKSFLEG